MPERMQPCLQAHDLLHTYNSIFVIYGRFVWCCCPGDGKRDGNRTCRWLVEPAALHAPLICLEVVGRGRGRRLASELLVGAIWQRKFACNLWQLTAVSAVNY
jgi:hypothetical protein